MTGVTVSGFNAALEAFEWLRWGYGQDVAWVVGVGAEYGAYLEFGTSKMPPYPYLFPAARDVMRRDFLTLEAQAHSKTQPIPWLVQEVALAIEGQAKRNVTAPGGDRSPGTHPDHPQVDTGNLRSSIEAAPVGEFGPGGRFPSPSGQVSLGRFR